MSRVLLGAAALGVGCSTEYAPHCTREPDDPEAAMSCTGVCINEISAANELYVTDRQDFHHLDPAEATEDWLELYNNTDQPVWLGDLELERKDNANMTSPLSAALEILPRDCLLLVASGEEEQRGERTLSFDLNSDFGTVRLWRRQDNGSRCLLDRLFYGRQQPAKSLGRSRRAEPQDGGPQWHKQAPTPCGSPPALGGGPWETGGTGSNGGTGSTGGTGSNGGTGSPP